MKNAGIVLAVASSCEVVAVAVNHVGNAPVAALAVDRVSAPATFAVVTADTAIDGDREPHEVDQT